MSEAGADNAPDALAGIRRMGAVFDDQVLARTYELCLPLQRQAPKAGIAIERDLAYGPDARHRLDAFLPQRRTEGAPIIAFLHGGGYIGGERSPVPGLIYAGPRIAGALLVSGVYAALHPRYSEEPPRPNQTAYYGDDRSRWPDMWPFDHVRPGHPPAFIVSAELEPYYFAWPSVALIDALVRCDRRLPDVRVLPGHNHVSSVLLVNSAIDDLGPDMLRFIRAHSGARGV
jgi:hypothetical protein